MNKLMAVLKWVFIVAAVIAACLYYDKQDVQTRLLIGIACLIAYQIWISEKREIEKTKTAAKDKLYQIEYNKNIIAVDSDNVVATMELHHVLPFVPYPGLSVVDYKMPMPENSDKPDNHEFGEYYTGQITKVTYRYNRFVCEVEPHKLTAQNDLLEVLEAHYEYEWKLWLEFDLKRMVIENLEKKIAAIGETTNEKELDKKWKFEALLKKVNSK